MFLFHVEVDKMDLGSKAGFICWKIDVLNKYLIHQ